ncbi:MAG: hypothetical protein HZY76_03420 [Anaerolineae bacterium]|nr:MAG: hypothetical protein HZY76_03420 [Anaerolineae bacterium]
MLSGLNSPHSIAVNSRAGKLYWQEPNQIKRANLDGSGVETLVDLAPPDQHDPGSGVAGSTGPRRPHRRPAAAITRPSGGGPTCLARTPAR